MKLRIMDRLLIGLCGLVLVCTALALMADAFFGAPVVAALERILTLGDAGAVIGFILLCAALMALGGYCVSMLWQKSKGKRGFVHQKAENGDIGISLKAIESLVVKCIERHEEICVSHISISEVRGGLLIKLRVDMASGMNIPLAVGALQKQIRQYVTACSGVDVAEVRVQVDESAQSGANSPYAVVDVPSALPMEEPQPSNPPAAAAEPVEMPAMPQMPVQEDAGEERPMHQRLFCQEEEPALVPVPPQEDAGEAPQAPVMEVEAPEEEDAEAPVMDFPEEPIPQDEPVPEIAFEEPVQENPEEATEISVQEIEQEDKSAPVPVEKDEDEPEE